MSHGDFLTDMYKEYENDKIDWVEKKSVVDKAKAKYYGNQLEHYELLRLIIYKLEEKKYNKEYLLFLEKLLFTLLEENAISFMSIKDEKPEIYFNAGLNNILKKYPEIFENDRGLSISNTQVSQLIDQLHVKPVTKKIEEARKDRKPPSPYARPKANGGRKTKRKKKRFTKKRRSVKINKQKNYKKKSGKF